MPVIGTPALETEEAQHKRAFIDLVSNHHEEVLRACQHFEDLQKGEEQWEFYDYFKRDLRVLHDTSRDMLHATQMATDGDLRTLIAETAERCAGLANTWRARMDGNIELARRKAEKA